MPSFKLFPVPCFLVMFSYRIHSQSIVGSSAPSSAPASSISLDLPSDEFMTMSNTYRFIQYDTGYSNPPSADYIERCAPYTAADPTLGIFATYRTMFWYYHSVIGRSYYPNVMYNEDCNSVMNLFNPQLFINKYSSTVFPLYQCSPNRVAATNKCMQYQSCALFSIVNNKAPLTKYFVNGLTKFPELSDDDWQSRFPSGFAVGGYESLNGWVDYNTFIEKPGTEAGLYFCKMCRQINCPITCSNGQYAVPSPVRNQYKILENPITCTPCPAGTWMTCINKPDCTYSVPVLGETYNEMGGDVYDIGNGPVSSCYPCDSAHGKWHYRNSTRGIFINTQNYYCPGGDSPPALCPLGKSPKSTWTECVCPPGQYDVPGLGCQDCPAGFFCIDGVISSCPMHTYQEDTGASACKDCASPRTGTGKAVGSPCDINELLKWCDPSIPETQNQSLSMNCVPCTNCRRPFTTADVENLKNCYK